MIEKKWKDDEPIFNRVSNATLTCKDCVFRIDDSKIFGNTSRCKIFSIKPVAVLTGKDCDVKEIEE